MNTAHRRKLHWSCANSNFRSWHREKRDCPKLKIRIRIFRSIDLVLAVPRQSIWWLSILSFYQAGIWGQRSDSLTLQEEVFLQHIVISCFARRKIFSLSTASAQNQWPEESRPSTVEFGRTRYDKASYVRDHTMSILQIRFDRTEGSPLLHRSSFFLWTPMSIDGHLRAYVYMFPLLFSSWSKYSRIEH